MEEKKCTKCSDPKFFFNWWTLIGVYSLGCTFKVTYDMIKFLITLF
jgi:hypothetical protein